MRRSSCSSIVKKGFVLPLFREKTFFVLVFIAKSFPQNKILAMLRMLPCGNRGSASSVEIIIHDFYEPVKHILY